jgi:gas vesicle protein
MYYDDETRRFNFLSGLLFGAVLGAGLALIAAPQEPVRALRSRGRGRKTLRKRAGRRLDRFRDEVADSVSEMVTSGRRYLKS